jgi:peptidyl-prolyl cis-trans isomerase D
MLTAFRNFAKSPAATVLFGLLILAMAGFGISRYGFSAIRGDEVIKAGSRVMNSAEFRREYDQAKKRYEEQSGQQITPEAAAANHLDAAVLNQLALREAFSAMLEKVGVRPSDKLILDQVKQIPAFFDPVNGRFDKKTFQQRLQENGLTPALFDREVRDQLAVQHFAAGLGNGLRAPRAYGALAAIYALEARDVAYFPVTAQSIGQVAPPTDAQLTAFMNQHRAQLTRPETRVLTVVNFKPDPAAATGPITQAELQKRYDFRKDTFSKPETRTLIQIPAKTAQAAQQIAARLGKGEAPEAIAKSFGVEPITYQDKPQTAVPDKKLAAAAFGLQAGQVATLQGDLGTAVVKVVSVNPGRTVSLEEARPMLEAEIRKDQATEQVYNQSQAYDDAHQAGANLADAAKKAGATPVTVGPVSQQGVDEKGQPVAAVNPRILEEAWTLPSGGESELTDTGDGQYFAVKVEKIIPAAVPPLEELRPMLTREWIRQETIRRMEARANELIARIKKGETLDAVAASAGATVTRATGLSRQAAGQNPAIPRDVLARAFSVRSGETFTAPLTETFAFAVGQATNIRMTPDPTAGQLAEGQRGAMTQDIFREMAQAGQAYSRAKLKVRTDPPRARAAAGLPEEEAAAGAPAKKK